MIAGMESGEPGWLQDLQKGAASLVGSEGLAASVVLAVALVLIAVGVYLPARIAKATLVLAIVVAAFIWVFGEALGGILAGGGTDVNSGPLLALLALAYWPLRRPSASPHAGPAKADVAADEGEARDDSRLDPGHIRRVMLVVAAVSAARLVAARPWQRGAVITDTDVSHLLMGIAMAGMLAPSLTTLPNGAWVVVFALLTVWFGYRVVRDYQANGARALAVGHCAPHLVHSAAMVYMFAAITAPAAGGGSGWAAWAGCPGGMHTLSYPDPGVPLRAHPDRLHGLGPRPVVQPPARPRRGRRRAGVPAMAAPRPGPSPRGPGADVAAGADARPTAGSPRVGPRRAGQPRAAAVPGSPSCSPGTVGCRIAMGVTMALMLILMI